MPIDLSESERAVIQRLTREAAASRQRVTGRCAVCGEQFSGLTLRRYCSDACRMKALRQRKRATAGD